MHAVLRAQALIVLALLALAGGAKAKPHPLSLALTFDDLPSTGPTVPGETRLDVAARILAALKAARVPPVYGFVNGISLGADPTARRVLPAWRAAGFPLGNHTFSHPDLNEITEAQFEADVLKNEPILREQMAGADWRWLRFPYLSTGATPEAEAGARAFLHAHRYKVAAVTMDFDDWAFDPPYARCLAKGDQAGLMRLEDAYLQAASDAADYSRLMSKTAFGRDIPYVLLMHVGHIDARMLPRLLALYRRRGFRFVTLQQAEADPFYRSQTDLGTAAGPDSLAAALVAKDILVPPEKTDLAWLDGLCA